MPRIRAGRWLLYVSTAGTSCRIGLRFARLLDQSGSRLLGNWFLSLLCGDCGQDTVLVIQGSWAKKEREGRRPISLRKPNIYRWHKRQIWNRLGTLARSERRWIIWNPFLLYFIEFAGMIWFQLYKEVGQRKIERDGLRNCPQSIW
jgi:hypothetical protein